MRHVTQQLFNASDEQLRIASHNVELARQFNAMHPRIVATATNESFGEKIKKAADKRRNASKQVQQPPVRHRKVQPRKRGKSE